MALLFDFAHFAGAQTHVFHNKVFFLFLFLTVFFGVRKEEVSFFFVIFHESV